MLDQVASKSDTDLWFGTSGPRDAEIVIVAESWGNEEKAAKIPLIGAAGTEFTRMLHEAGIDRRKCLITNIVSERPENNEMFRFFHPNKSPSGRPLIRGLDPRDNVTSGVRTVYQQILAHPRRCIIALGNYALWALTAQSGVVPLRKSNNRKLSAELVTKVPNGIGNWRGSMWYFEPLPEFLPDGPDRDGMIAYAKRTPLLPILHPASILRQWDQRSVTVHDLRARVSMALRGDWRHSVAPTILAPPSFDQLQSTIYNWLGRADRGEKFDLTGDIETQRGLITCIGFADSSMFSMVIPFIKRLAEDKWDSWWTLAQETEILYLLRRLMTHPNITLVGQNFIYDTQYIQRWFGFTPRCGGDTMLAQNVLFPGTDKDLATLSSLFCKYHWFWKEDGKEWDTKGTITDLLYYNGWDNLRTFEIWETQKGLLTAGGFWPQMEYKMESWYFCLRMMNRGVRIDTQKKMSTWFALNQAREELYKELLEIIPQNWVSPGAKTPWYRSSKQQMFLFYDQLGMVPVKHRKTKEDTIGKDALNELGNKYPEFEGIFVRLRKASQVSNTMGVLMSQLDTDNRMRCSFNPAGTETHRLSSSKNVFGGGTNLQNLSKGEEDD